MPRQPNQESAEDRALREIMAEDDAVMQRLAAESGPPPDSQRLSPAEEDRLYAQTDPLVHNDPEGFAKRLMVQGIDQQTLGQLQVLKGFPEWAPLYSAPTQSAELANDLTIYARWPYRPAMLADMADPEEMTQRAEALNRRYQRTHAERMAQAEQPIQLAPPTMPTGMAPAPTPPPAAPPPVVRSPAAAGPLPLSSPSMPPPQVEPVPTPPPQPSMMGG